MTLEEFIEKVKLENNLSYPVKDINDYIMKKARETIKGKAGAVDDDTVRKWVLEYQPKEDKKEEPKIEKPAGITEKKEEEWGSQTSLF